MFLKNISALEIAKAFLLSLPSSASSPMGVNPARGASPGKTFRFWSWRHFRVFNYEVEFRYRARREFLYAARFKHSHHSHFVWWRFSLVWGQPHLTPMTVCAHCAEEIQRVGEDYLDWCEGCQQLEGDTMEITVEEYEAAHG